MAGHFPEQPRPNELERFVGRYLDDWIERTKKAEQERLKSKGEGPATFAGLGARARDAWEQWMEYVLDLNEGGEDGVVADVEDDEGEA